MFAKNQNVKKNFYTILGVAQNATLPEIKKAFRTLAMHYHPDKAAYSHLTSKEAEDKFKELNQAYETLSSPQKRSLYDLSLDSINPDLSPKPQEDDLDEFLRSLDKLRKKSGASFKAPKFREDFYDFPEFTSEFKKKAESPPSSKFSEPSSANQTIIDEIIRNDNATQLDQYLKQNNFGSSCLLEKLLTSATKQGCLNCVKYLVEERKQNPNLFVTGDAFFQGTLFKYAAASGNLELVKYLLEQHKADIESQATFFPGCCGSALSYAAEKGHAHIVDYLISKGAKVNPEVANSNILNRAIRSGSLAVFKSLVEAGSKLGDYHFDEALKHGCMEIAQYILKIKPGIHNHRYLFHKSLPAISVIQSGNLDLLKYLEKYEGLDLFQSNEDIKNIHVALLCAAARSGSIEMVHYLLEETALTSECEKIKSSNNNVEAILMDAVYENHGLGFDGRKVDVQTRLNMVRYLIEDKKFTLPFDKFNHVIQEKAKFSSIEMNAYLQSYLPALANYRTMLLYIASKGIAAISHEELFRLYILDIIKRGTSDHFADNIHYQIQNRKISTNELKELLAKNSQFAIDALFYFSNFYFDFNGNKDLKSLQTVLDSGIDVNAENERGEIAVDFAMRQGGYNAIVEFLIDRGADVYKKNKAGNSIYDLLHTNKKFLSQLKKISESKSKIQKNDPTLSEQTNTFFKDAKILGAAAEKTIAVADKPLHLGGKI